MNVLRLMLTQPPNKSNIIIIKKRGKEGEVFLFIAIVSVAVGAAQKVLPLWPSTEQHNGDIFSENNRFLAQ